MPETTYVKAITGALARAMRDDPRVFVLGEDVTQGGPYTATAGLAEEFGTDRVRNTPISEAAITGVAIGAAQSGLRPVLEIMFVDFVTLALDQLANAAAKAHAMSGGQLSVPLVLRTQGGAGQRGAAQHSQSLEGWLTHIPGLKVVMPSGAADAAGLLTSAIADPDPVVVVEHKALYFRREDLPETPAPVPIGRARVVRAGRDVTIVALSRMVPEALAAADRLAGEGIEAEVVDPRTLVPLDLETIVASVRRTGHLVIAHEAVVHSGFGAEIAALVGQEAFDDLDAPIERVGAPFAPVPFSPPLEDAYVPGSDDVVAAVATALNRDIGRRTPARNAQGGGAMRKGASRIRSALAVAVLALTMSLALAACGGDNGSTSTSADTGASTGTAAPAETTAASGPASKCGLGNGEKATGQPIKLGAIATKQPGTDFSEIPRTAKAYFDCVNDNGGINGRPIQYVIETDQTDPGQVASLAKKLIDSDKVLGLVGGSSLIDCAVNHKFYESQGYNVIDAGIAPECYTTSNSAPVNMGPRYSSDGAVQYILKQDVKKIVFDQSNVPGTGYIEAGPIALAKDAGVPLESIKDNVPIQDANSIALKLVQAAGDDGGVVLNFTPPEALKILQAAEQQGLAQRVKWACSTPCNTDFLAEALGSSWDGQLFVNAELNLPSADGPDSNLYRQVLKQYAPDIPLGSFSQMGFVQGRIATDALMNMKGDYTPETVNKAFEDVKDFKTDILCKPWYYGKAPLHIPNNTDRTVTPKEGKMVEQEGCTDISAVDPDIAKVRKIEQEQGIG